MPVAIPLGGQLRSAASVADGGLLENVAEVVDLQRQCVLDARIGRVALIVVTDCLAGVDEEDGMPVGATGLQGADAEVLLGDGVGREGAPDLCGRGAGMLGVVGIDLLPQHRALEGAAGLTLLFQRQAGRDDGVIQQQRSRGIDGEAGLAEVLAFEVARDAFPPEVCAGVEPGLGVHRRHMRCGRDVVCRDVANGERRDLFRVPLFDHAEAPELALHAVEIAVVVGVAGDKAAAIDVVVGVNAFDYMHREWQPGDPRGAVSLVLQVELGRGGVVNAGLGAEVVDGLDQQMRLLSAH